MLNQDRIDTRRGYAIFRGISVAFGGADEQWFDALSASVEQAKCASDLHKAREKMRKS